MASSHGVAAPLRARPVVGLEEADPIEQFCEELAVLELAKRLRSRDDVEQFLHATRSALFKAPTVEFDPFTLPDILEIGSPKSILGPDIDEPLLSTCPEDTNLPMNVRLGVEVFLQMISALDLANNPHALSALLRRLPNMLQELPPLSLTDSCMVAREVYIDTQMRLANLSGNDGHELDNFQKRKAKIARELERRKRMSAAMTANAGIPSAVSRVLEDAYYGTVSSVRHRKHQKQAAGTSRKVYTGPAFLENDSHSHQTDLTHGNLLSTWLGLSIKRGALSGLAKVIRVLLHHGSTVNATTFLSNTRPTERAESEEETKSPEAYDRSSMSVRCEQESLITDFKGPSLLQQEASEDLDVETFLREIAVVQTNTVLQAFQPPEQGDIGGTLFTFGKGDHGKLGHGKCTEVDPNPQPHLHEHCPDGYCTENIKSPRMVLDLESVSVCKVASLSTHSVALSSEGVLYTWGNGDKNRLGHGTTAKEYYPRIVNSLLTRPPVVDIACGLGHTLALLENGHLYAWGNGGNGRLGLGDTEDRALACLVTKFVTDPSDEKYLQDPVKQSSFKMPAGIRLVGLHCGASHSMAVAEDGRCFTWGKNNQGQCGHGDVADKLYPQLVEYFVKNNAAKEQQGSDDEGPRLVDVDNSIRSMAGGWEHTLALTRDGRLFSFGSGYKDSRRSGLPPVLGHGGTEREPRPRQILALQSQTIKYCTCGWDHSMAINEHGHVYSWGAGTNGKLGHGDEESHPLPKRVESLIRENVRIVQVEAGCEHSVAVSDEGYLFTWGHGDSGRLGHATSRTEKRPKRVESLVEQGLPVLTVAVGDKYNLVLIQSDAAIKASQVSSTYSAKDTAEQETEQHKQDEECDETDPEVFPEEKNGQTFLKENDRIQSDVFKVKASLAESTKKTMGRSSQGALEKGRLSEALLGLASFELPCDDDELLSEWLLRADRSALFVLAHMERIASNVANVFISEGMNTNDGENETSNTSTQQSSSIYAPGYIPSWKQFSVSNQSSDKSSCDTTHNDEEQDDRGSIFVPGTRAWKEAIWRNLLDGGSLDKISLPYCIETTSEGFSGLVQLLKETLSLIKTQQQDHQTSAEYQCACQEGQDSCSDARWFAIWATLRIVCVNLMTLNKLEAKEGSQEYRLKPSGAKWDLTMKQLHEVLLKIVGMDFEGHKARQASSNSPRSNNSDKRITCFEINEKAKQEVVMVAATALQEGFKEFYPTAESRLGLLRYMLETSTKARAGGDSNSRVLDILMTNLARDDAMQPLVAGMASSEFDTLSLLSDLLQNSHRPSHCQLLLAFQSHAFAVWSDTEYSKLRDVLIQFSVQVFNVSASRVVAMKNKTLESDKLLSVVLPQLVSALIVTQTVPLQEQSALLPPLRALFDCMIKSSMTSVVAGETGRLVARLCGKFLCQDLCQGLGELLLYIRHVKTKPTLVAELTYHLPYARTWCGESIVVCGNPDLFGPTRSEVTRLNNQNLLHKRNQACVPLETAVAFICELVVLDTSSSAQIALISLIAAHQENISAKQLETLLDAVLSRYESVNHFQSQEICSSNSFTFNSDLEQIWRSMIALATAASKRPDLSTSTLRRKFSDWVVSEISILNKELHDYAEHETRLGMFLSEGAFVSTQLNGKLVPESIPEGSIQAEDDDDLDRAVDKVLRGALGENATASNTAELVAQVPPDQIAAKGFSLSFWMTKSSGHTLDEELLDGNPRVILARCQRRDNEDDGPLQSQHPLLQQGLSCEEHSIVAHPIILLRKPDRGDKCSSQDAVVEVLISTILLEDAKRSTLVEHASVGVPIDSFQSWMYVSISVDMVSRSLILSVNGGKFSKIVKLRGQVLRKTSSSVPVRFGGWKGSTEISKANADQCTAAQDGCSLNFFSRVLDRGAPVVVSDVMWHQKSATDSEMLQLYKLGRCADWQASAARAELHANRLLQFVEDGLLPLSQNGLALTKELFSLTRWLSVQQRVLLVLEAHEDWSGLLKLYQGYVKTRAAKAYCPCCQEGAPGLLLSLRTRAGYEPFLRDEFFQDFVLAARAQLSRRCTDLLPPPSKQGMCEACSAISKTFDWSRTLAHQASFNAALIRGAQAALVHLKTSEADSLLAEPEGVLDLYGVNPSGALCQQSSVLLKTPYGIVAGKIIDVFETGRLMKTFCLQQEDHFLPCHASIFNAGGVDGLYPFYVSDEAAIAALEVARLKGLFSTLDEPLSPKSPGSPTGRMPGKHAGLTVWERQGATLVRRTGYLSERDRDALLRLDYNALCKPVAKKQSDKFGPASWYLDMVAHVELEGGEQRWIPVAHLCSVPDEPKFKFPEVHTLLKLCDEAMPSKTLIKESNRDGIAALKTLRDCLRVLCQASGLEDRSESIGNALIQSSKDTILAILNLALSNNEKLTAEFLKKCGCREGLSPDVARVLRQVSGNTRTSLRLLEAASIRLHERLCTEENSFGTNSGSSVLTKGSCFEENGDSNSTTQVLSRVGGCQSTTQAVSAQGQPRQSSSLFSLETMSGDIQLDQRGLRAQGVGNFSTVRLKQIVPPMASEAGLDGVIALKEGKWYYEVVLMSDQAMQIGWADSRFQTSVEQSIGVGNHANSWAFDGFRGRFLSGSEIHSYGPGMPWQVGDVVGCSLDIDASILSYSLNGLNLGIATRLPSVSEGLFPAVSFTMGQSARFVLDNFNYSPQDGYQSILNSLGGTSCKMFMPSLNEDLAEIEQDIQFIQETLGQDDGTIAGDGAPLDQSPQEFQENAAHSPSQEERGQRIVDALLATGLPMEWCRRAVDHVAREAEETGSAFDENAAISWVMDRMMQEDGQESLIRSMVLEGAGIGMSENSERHDDAKTPREFLVYEEALSGDAFNLEAEVAQSQMQSYSSSPVWERVTTAAFDEPTGAQARRRAIATTWSEASGSTSTSLIGGDSAALGGLSLSIPTLGKSNNFDRGELPIPALLQFVERARSSELEACTVAVNCALTIEYARSSLLALANASSALFQIGKHEDWIKLMRLTLFRGVNLYEHLHIYPLPRPYLSTSGYDALQHVLAGASQELLHSLTTEALRDLRRATKPAFGSVSWGSIRGTRRYTIMSVINSTSRYDPQLDHALCVATNGFRGEPHLMLSDEEALTQPSVELAVFLLSGILDTVRETPDFDPESSVIISADILGQLVDCLFCKNVAMKDAIIRLCSKVLRSVIRLFQQGSVSADWSRKLLSCIPVPILQRLFTKRYQKEQPFLNGTQHTGYIHGLLELLVAVERLERLLKCRSSATLNSADDANKISSNLRLNASHITEDSILLTWKRGLVSSSSQSDFHNEEDADHIDQSERVHGSGEANARRESASISRINFRRGSGQADSGSNRSHDTFASEYGRGDDEQPSPYGSFRGIDLAEDDSNGGTADPQSSLRHIGRTRASVNREPSDRIAQQEEFRVRPGTVRVLEYSLDREGLEWKTLAELPAAAQSYLMECAHPDTTYRFRMRLRAPFEEDVQSPGSTKTRTPTGPVTIVDTLLQPVLMLSSEQCGPNLILSSLNRSVRNTVNKKWNAVRCNVGFTRGVHSWEVHIDHCVSKNIFVGVCTKEASMDNYVGADAYGWAYLSNRAIWHNKSKLKSYGEVFREGDVIRVTLDCDARTLSFARNGIDYGVAVESLQPDMYFPAVSLYNEKDAVTIRFMSKDSDVDETQVSSNLGTATANRTVKHVYLIQTLLELLEGKVAVSDLEPTLTTRLQNMLACLPPTIRERRKSLSRSQTVPALEADPDTKDELPTTSQTYSDHSAELHQESGSIGKKLQNLLTGWTLEQDKHLCSILRSLSVVEQDFSSASLESVVLNRECLEQYTEEKVRARACLFLLVHQLLAESWPLVEDFSNISDDSYETSMRKDVPFHTLAESQRQSLSLCGPGSVLEHLRLRDCDLF